MSRKKDPLACKWCGQTKPLIKAHIVSELNLWLTKGGDTS